MKKEKEETDLLVEGLESLQQLKRKLEDTLQNYELEFFELFSHAFNQQQVMTKFSCHLLVRIFAADCEIIFDCPATMIQFCRFLELHKIKGVDEAVWYTKNSGLVRLPYVPKNPSKGDHRKLLPASGVEYNMGSTIVGHVSKPRFYSFHSPLHPLIFY